MARRKATNAVQAFALTVLGALAGIAAAELGLRAAGAWLSHRAPAPGTEGRGIVVLCLGESTTAPTLPRDHSWPAQLAATLDALAPGRFTVVNEGRTGASSTQLQEFLPAALDEDAPDVVVAMVGINDGQWYSAPPRGLLRGLRVLKLARQAFAALSHKDAPNSSPTPSETQTAIAREVLRRGLALELLQYPGLDLSELEDRFAEFSGSADLVATKPAFDGAQAWSRYREFFSDRFAGTWGHCTEAGDRLIAAQAAHAVLAEAARRGLTARAPRLGPPYLARGRARIDLYGAPPAVMDPERARLLAEFRRSPELDTLSPLLFALEQEPRGSPLAAADRTLAIRVIDGADASGNPRLVRRARDARRSLGRNDVKSAR